MRALLIRVWIGPLPAWFPQWQAHMEAHREHGWDYLVVTDADELAARARNALGFELRPEPGTRKACEYDPALGEMFADRIQGYDWWGHCNLDCVYGRLEHWLTPGYLESCDLWGNDPDAICGPLSLYRNTPAVNSLFREVPEWKSIFQSPHFYGFDETRFNAAVHIAAARGEVRFKSSFWQSHDKQWGHHDKPRMELRGRELWDQVKNQEVLMFHFNRSRKWPILES